MDNIFEEDIKKCLETLRDGGIILYPTDTIWGLGCDATNEKAVERIYKIKQRTDSKALLLLVDSVAKLPAYISEIPDIAYDLTELSERPMTIIYSDARNLPSSLLAADGSIGIRVTAEKFSKMLCERFRKPIVSTSANISGEPSPKNFAEISENILKSVDYIVKYRQDEKTEAKPSSIIKLEKGNVFQLIRK